MIVVGVVILLVSALIAVTVSVATRRTLIGQLDDSLLAFSSRPAPAPIPNEPGVGFDVFQPFASIRLDRDGLVLVTQPSGYADDPDPLPDVGGLTVADLGPNTFLSLDTVAESGSARVLVREAPGGYMLFAQSLDEVDAAARQAVTVSLVVSFAAAVAGIAAAWLLVRRGFQPVDDMIETAGAIADGDLTRRTDLVDSNTELGRLASALDHMLARVEGADRDRFREAERLRRFADDASHELRTPIAAIAGYAELYNAGGVEAGPGLDRAMSRITEASDRAGRLIEDLLALARLNREIGANRARIDLGALVNDIAEDSRISTGRDIRSDVDGPVWVDGDSVWLRQAIENLVGNAVSHAPASKSIELIASQAADRAQLMVVDHGPGIPESERERVFDRFARPDTGRDRSQGGAGLGLAIVREVVSSHGGEVQIAETPGGGATVEVRLPLADSR
ncbi:MAG: HAMP domain-containing sensor histidine kinase [Acidimicrobiia bacterium]|nr:HAMP domain-containing sensor histidine kinase [Acidimicrobiia bacterium]